MRIVERKEDHVLVAYENDTQAQGHLVVFLPSGDPDYEIEVPAGGIASLRVPYDAHVAVTYEGKSAEDNLYVGSNKPENIRAAATRRFVSHVGV